MKATDRYKPSRGNEYTCNNKVGRHAFYAVSVEVRGQLLDLSRAQSFQDLLPSRLLTEYTMIKICRIILHVVCLLQFVALEQKHTLIN
jgi:hypothetical protein